MEEEDDELTYSINRYADIVVDPQSVPPDPQDFRLMLRRVIDGRQGREDQKAIWLELPYDRSHLIPHAIDLGFRGHHCTDRYFMLTQWFGDKDDIKLPNYGTHIVRVEALLLRDDPQRPGVKQVLVVRERYSKGRRGHDWKLLSGAVEPGEFIDQAIIREVREEVGLNVRFGTVVGHGNRVSTKFGRNEICFCCHLTMSPTEEARSDNLTIQRSELEDARWMDVRDAIGEWQQNYRLRGLEKRCLLSALKNRGLVTYVSDDQRGPPHKMLGHFVGIPHHELPHVPNGGIRPRRSGYVFRHRDDYPFSTSPNKFEGFHFNK